MHRCCRLAILTVVALAPLAGGCSHPDQPESRVQENVGIWPPELKRSLALNDGTWDWQWRQTDGRCGCCSLTLTGNVYCWQLSGDPGDTTLELTPCDTAWLAITLDAPGDLATTPPLPRMALISDAWPDLVSMLCALITPRFEAKVTHWPTTPVPVSAPDAVSGDVDLGHPSRSLRGKHPPSTSGGPDDPPGQPRPTARDPHRRGG